MDAIDKINIILAQKGLTGADLSRAIGVSSGVYSQWSARITKPSNKSLFKIAEVLGVDVAEILSDGENDKASFYDRFLELCEEKKVPPTKACVEMGVSRGLASKWKASGTSKPATDILEKMSEYFGLTIDEILSPREANNSFYTRFAALCLKKNVSVTRAAEEIGLARTIGTKWRKTDALPNGETLVKISKYFGVSIDELLGINESSGATASIELSNDELQLVLWFRAQASKKDKIIVKAIMEAESE